MRRQFVAVAACAAVALAGCSSGETTTPEPSSTSSSVSTTAPSSETAPTSTEAAPVTEPAETPAGCTPATEDEMAPISAALTGDAASLGGLFTEYDGTYHYFGANIYDAEGERVSSADVWIIDSGVPYALSGGAREYTLLPDGRDLPGSPSAGDDTGSAVQDCSASAL